MDLLTDIEEDLILESEEESLSTVCICSLPSAVDLILCNGPKCPQLVSTIARALVFCALPVIRDRRMGLPRRTWYAM